MAYSDLPLLDASLVDRDRAAFIAQLRTLLIEHGFLYLQNAPVPADLVKNMTDATAQFFALPSDIKEACDTNYTAHFNGYVRRGTIEKPTREQFNYGADNATPKEGSPEYHKLHGSTPWPDESVFPGGRVVMREYYKYLKDLSLNFTRYVAEALGLGAMGLEHLFEPEIEDRQLRCKLLRYPQGPPSTEGFYPHTDANFLTYLLQATPEPGLELQMPTGEWLPATAIPGTYIVFVGDVLEKITKGVVKAPLHRVLSPTTGTRHSVGFFQGVSMDTRIVDVKLDIPQEIIDLKRERQLRYGEDTAKEYPFVPNDYLTTGQSVLNMKLTAHPLVAYKFYPKLFPQFYPDGLPEKYARLVDSGPSKA
ncbi:Clavaminate synthase-like protein [Roridomyces roridus]|uniref:Clavaminate synthase-like protein n=1 Tax=Roridomyces roridus TaxID=1738132 RepID=A0AAD7C7D2_9AGAR|nr:Clavaminate synthase-like protein [Roridomyces roridus]